MMRNWEQLTIFIDESDQWHGKPLYIALVEAARNQGLAGATVVRGIAGYGMRQHHRLHTARIMELADLPLMMIIIDRAEKITHFLPIVTEMVSVGLVTHSPVNVVHHGLTDD
jgi:PII-like signaling protein